MGKNARLKNGHARVETRVLKMRACRKMSEASLSIGRQRVGAFKKRACRKRPLLDYLNIIVCSGMREPLACRSAC